jgi:TM2 domain-containing membrane protein YozV
MMPEASDKSRLVTLVLAVTLGLFGGHRFYTGKVKSGILMACTVGGLGLWCLYDIIVVAAGGFEDAEGRLVSNWEVEPHRELSASPELMDEIDALRREVAELTERVDFAERLLANPRREEPREHGPAGQ